MNLHSIAAGIIGAVNPQIQATWRKSRGTFTTAPDGKRTPNYQDAVGAMVQMQALSGKELAHVNNLGIQGILRALHVNGDVRGVSRTRQEGGDLFVIKGETWLVVQVMETWPDWSRVAICLQ